MTIKEVQDNIIDEFSLFDDWMDKYNLLIDHWKRASCNRSRYKAKDFLIEGCQSKVWLHPEYDGSMISFHGRQRCNNYKRHCGSSDKSFVKKITGRDNIFRSLLHR